MDYYLDSFGSYIVPPVLEGSSERQPAPSYETPWWEDTINRAIERAYQAYTIQEAGYPSYPTFPQRSPAPAPMPIPAPGDQPQREGIQLSQTTLMLIVGGVLLFMLGKRGR